MQQGGRAPRVGTERPSGEDDAQRVERAEAPRNRVPADGEVAKTKGGKGSGRAATRSAGAGRARARADPWLTRVARVDRRACRA